jgi:exodeoxyribonuclease-3
MKIAAWNVNSLNVRLPHLIDWLKTASPDVVCLQELKLEDAKFPLEAINEAGYNAVFSGQKTYNGVAILSKTRAEDVIKGIPGYTDDQKRLIAGTVDGLRIVCVYIPNGQSVDSDKYRYKLEWLAALTAYLKSEIAQHPSLALLGDYNIAPDDRDVHDPAAWAGQVLCTDAERAAFTGMLELGLKDSFRLFEQPPATFSWWDYRMNAFRRKMGLRIDHVLLTAPLAARCSSSVIDIEPRTWERPSDHAPAVVTLG